MANQQSRLDDLEDRWLVLVQTGDPPTVAELCGDSPELIPELEARLTVLRKFMNLERPEHFSAKFEMKLPTVGQVGHQDGDLADRTGSFEKLMSVCQEFAALGSTDSLRRIEDALLDVSEVERPAVFRNLLYMELEKRRGDRVYPRVDDYIARFPAFASIVRDVFLDHSSVSGDAGETGGSTPAGGVGPALRRLGNYRLVRELGRGAMGIVFEAVHVERGTKVALKTLPSVDGGALQRFKREFRSIADLNHPNLIGLHTLESDGGHWFYTMDLLDGTDFLSFVRPGAVNEARLRSAFTQLVTGVMALHARGIIHRDLKPSNVLVTNDGRVVVLDFGLVIESDMPGQTRSLDRIAGTPRYMAPEQAAGGVVTPAADWYAVGVMLYEALCGSAPFAGSLYHVLNEKQRRDAPPLPSDPQIPSDLAALSMALLDRNVGRRPDMLAIARVISTGTIPAAESKAGSRELVGRDQQIASLLEAFRTVQSTREPSTVFISGRSGEGKTALAESFVAKVKEAGLAVAMSGRCYDRESVPFKALDALIDALGGYLRGLPEAEANLLMPDDVGLLAQVFPVLQRVEVVAQAADPRVLSIDEHQIRQRAFRALRSLLVRLCRRSPVVWLIDDLQWGDADSASALFEVLRPPEGPSVLFLGTYRSDETGDSPFLGAWKELQRKNDVRFPDLEVHVSPLADDECVELVVRTLGQDTPAIRDRAVEFARETRGNPFLLIELLECFDPDTNSFESMPLHDVLSKKLARLPSDARDLLDVVAVSGQALLVSDASLAAGHGNQPTTTLSRMRNERLIRILGSDQFPLVDTYHDRVRETTLAGMTAENRRVRHHTLAEVIEQSSVDFKASPREPPGLDLIHLRVAVESNPRAFDLAYHFDAAGEKTKACFYAMQAAEQARRQSALEVAVNNYAIARRNSGEADNSVRYRIAVGESEALMLLGRNQEAMARLEGATDLVEDAVPKARIEALQGEIVFHQGRVEQSSVILEKGLRRLGYWVPRTLFGFGYGIAREFLIQCVHTTMPFLLHRKSPSPERMLAVQFCQRLSHSYIFQNTVKLLWAHLAGLNRSERMPASAVLSETYAMHSTVMAMLGWRSRGRRYGHRALAMARDFDDLLGQGQAFYHHGIGLYAAASYDEGLTQLGEAIRSLEKAGDPYGLHLAHFHRGCCHLGLGDLASAFEEARWTFNSSARMGDSRVLCSSYLWARVTRGDFPFERLKSCFPCRPDDIMSTVHGVMAEGHWHAYHGRTLESLEAFEKAWEMALTSRCLNSHTIVALPELADALRRHAVTLRISDPKQSRRLSGKAARLSRWATRLTRFFPAAYPQSLRGRALILADLGKTRKALRLAAKSCVVAEAQKARYEHARSLLVQGQLAKTLGRTEADDQIREAEELIAAIEAPLTTHGTAAKAGR